MNKRYSEKSLKRIIDNIIIGEIAPTLTANAMQSVNHQNCLLIMVKNNECKVKEAN